MQLKHESYVIFTLFFTVFILRSQLKGFFNHRDGVLAFIRSYFFFSSFASFAACFIFRGICLAASGIKNAHQRDYRRAQPYITMHKGEAILYQWESSPHVASSSFGKK